jgi:hypothetical protein
MANGKEIKIVTKTKTPVATALLAAITVAAISASLGLSAVYAGLALSRQYWQARPRRYYVNRNVNRNVSRNVNRNVNRNANANANANANVAALSAGASVKFIRGDANMDGTVDIGDIIAISAYVDTGGSLPCLDAADANDSGNVDIHDVAYLTAYLYGNGPRLPIPFPRAGIDPTLDSLDCGTVISGKAPATFVRGDANMDGQIDISDAIKISNYINNKESINCLDAADVNDDGNVDVHDMAYIIYYLYSGGSEPEMPFPKAGVDPTNDSLTCKQ